MRIVLMLDEGASYNDIKDKLDTTANYLALEAALPRGRTGGLGHVSSWTATPEVDAAVAAKILAKTQEPPPDGSTHWSLRKMAAVMGVGKDLIRQVWREADLKPHRLDRYMAGNDPQFEQKSRSDHRGVLESAAA